MLRILGGPKRLCDGLTRRDLLHVGSLGLIGLGLREWSSASTARAGGTLPSSSLPGFGRAKACILLFMYGSPSQLETFDPKPEAPEEIRGEFGCIASSVPGLNVCDRLPRLSQVMDKVTLIRSVTHPYPIHGVAFATTGIQRIDVPLELNPRDPNHWPFIGSAVDYIDGRRAAKEKGRGGRLPIPRNLVLPWAFSSHRVGEVPRSGPYGGFLGQAYDPVSTEFVGRATKTARKTLADKVWEDLEPYRGITPESRFALSAVSNLPAELTLDRLDRRRTLLDQLEQSRARPMPRSPDPRASTGTARWRTTSPAHRPSGGRSTSMRKRTRRDRSTA